MMRPNESRRILTREDCEAIAQRVKRLVRIEGPVEMYITSWWTGALRWGRNRVTLAGDRRDVQIDVRRPVRRDLGGISAVGITHTNQLDDDSIEGLVREFERKMRFSLRYLRPGRTPDLGWPEPPPENPPKMAIWSDATYNVTAEERGRVARALVEPAEAAGMLSAGYAVVGAQSWARVPTAGRVIYTAGTQAQCSMTVRDPGGTGSGWAGLSGYAWERLDPEALAERALEKALASRNPVALEPGRYTVILEPQAVGDLVGAMMTHPATWAWRGRPAAEAGMGPFTASHDQTLQLWHTKLGEKVIDERISITYDPADPELGIINPWEPLRPVTWIDHGVLTTLPYPREYALTKLDENFNSPPAWAFRMSGGTATTDEMIRSTVRGLLVTRFSDVSGLDDKSMLMTGLTRDGLWLVEHGKITKAVKNFRFTESPLFVLNSVEQLGVPVPIFRPNYPAILPPLKARDFSFTSLIDAI